MKKICFAGLSAEKNLGDVVILKATEHLYKTALNSRKDIDFTRLNLQSNKNISPGFHRYKITIMDLLRFNTREVKIKKLVSDLRKQYRKNLENVDLIVVTGGGMIKYKYQRVFMYLTALIEVAEELNIPIVLNSVGVEGYDKNDARCQMLKKSINRAIVKSITTRDDFTTLKNLYMYPDNIKKIRKTADSAVYSDEVYNIKKKRSKIFGIGLVRGGIFQDNGIYITPNELADFYIQLISEVEERKIEYKLFTNGLESDNELLPLIMKKLGKDKLDIMEPKEDIELIEIISDFTVVIAARLHANIIAYALNIPSIGLVWNNKLKMFGNDIGYPERFIDSNNLNSKSILNSAIIANEEGYKPDFRNEYKASAKQHIEEILHKWLAGSL